VGHAEPVPIVPDSLDVHTQRWLREVVRSHVRAWQGRLVIRPDVWVGGPGVDACGVRVEEDLDDAVRFDMALALLDRLEPADSGSSGAAPTVTSPWLWLTRTGTLEIHDLDLAWLSAIVAAGEATGRRPRFIVVTRQGWSDPRSGAERRWARLRA
jgi:hypothetical protein